MIAWVGLLAILIVAVELIYTDIKIIFFNVSSKNNLKNKYALVTGAGKGKACSIALAEAEQQL